MAAGFFAAGLALLFAALVFAKGRASPLGRTLALLLLVEAVFQAAFASADLRPESLWEINAITLAFIAAGVLCAVYLRVLVRLETPLVAGLRRRSVRWALTTLFLGSSVALALMVYPKTVAGQEPAEDGLLLAPIVVNLLGMVVISLFAFFASISAWRRAPPGPSRERAGAFAVAFGARDLLFALGILSNILSDALPAAAREGALVVSNGLSVGGTLVYVPVLAYGILRTQLFDIDLKVKLGIKRSTVVTIALVVILGSAKTAEFYLNKTFGLLAGGIAAGAMLVLTPRLNKIGDKVANTAMPQVQPTSAYVSFKKLEVYRAAVESAHEVGLDDKQRLVLDRLRTKLGLVPADAAAVEAEVLTAGARPA